MTQDDVAALAVKLGLVEPELRLVQMADLAEITWVEGGCIAILRARGRSWSAIGAALSALRSSPAPTTEEG